MKCGTMPDARAFPFLHGKLSATMQIPAVLVVYSWVCAFAAPFAPAILTRTFDEDWLTITRAFLKGIRRKYLSNASAKVTSLARARSAALHRSDTANGSIY